jgi:hypothetical protein
MAGRAVVYSLSPAVSRPTHNCVTVINSVKQPIINTKYSILVFNSAECKKQSRHPTKANVVSNIFHQIQTRAYHTSDIDILNNSTKQKFIQSNEYFHRRFRHVQWTLWTK